MERKDEEDHSSSWLVLSRVPNKTGLGNSSQHVLSSVLDAALHTLFSEIFLFLVYSGMKKWILLLSLFYTWEYREVKQLGSSLVSDGVGIQTQAV